MCPTSEYLKRRCCHISLKNSNKKCSVGLPIIVGNYIFSYSNPHLMQFSQSRLTLPERFSFLWSWFEGRGSHCFNKSETQSTCRINCSSPNANECALESKWGKGPGSCVSPKARPKAQGELVRTILQRRRQFINHPCLCHSVHGKGAKAELLRSHVVVEFFFVT